MEGDIISFIEIVNESKSAPAKETKPADTNE
jgi:hypothetical protein